MPSRLNNNNNNNILIYNAPDSRGFWGAEVVTQHHCPGCSLKVMSNRYVFSLLLKVACDGLD